jgi:hypothetical protein
MPVAVVMDFKGATLDQYDAICAAMGLTPGGPVPPGALFHWAAQTDDGLRVTDVWETKEAFDAFAENEIGPKSAAAGVTGPPEMVFYEVHNYFK